jgi:lipopolysaccharide transport system permease protein
MPSFIREISQKRNLIRELVIKDLKVRYARPILGFLWAFLSPLFVVVIFYLVFSVILKVKTKEAPFILYLMSAVFTWRFFQDSLICSVTSLLDNKNLIRESQFPHYFLPVSIVLANFINFLPSFCILILSSLILLKGFPLFIIYLPFVLAIHIMTAMGMSLWASILYVKWRDTRYVLEAVLLMLFYSTPIFYSVFLVKESFSSLWFNVYINNPFAGILNLYRSIIFKGFYNLIKGDIGFFSLIVVPTGFGIAIFLSSLYLFKKNKNTINDYLSY